jgi:hypothetical protein
MGSDDDDAIHFGIGAKLALDDHISLRVDLRDIVSRRRGGNQGDGAHSPELTFGLTFTPTRRKPDFDGDTILDGYDLCPTVKGDVTHRGCPAPDADGDGVPDAEDGCPEVAGDKEDGCPTEFCPSDTDRDGILDRVDECPTEAGTPGNAGCAEEGQEPTLAATADSPAGAAEEPEETKAEPPEGEAATTGEEPGAPTSPEPTGGEPSDPANDAGAGE